MNTIRWSIKDRKSDDVVHLTHPGSERDGPRFKQVLLHLGAMPKGKRHRRHQEAA